MMLKLAKLGIAMAVLAVLIVPAAYAGVPDVSQSYFVPQEGPVTTPTEGVTAARDFATCPHNDNTGRFRTLSTRLKIVVLASNSAPIANIPAADICVLFNGGTTAQGFSGVGADSIIANSNGTNGSARGCNVVTCVQADAPTDANGVTYITWAGSTPGSPGVATRDPLRKWGQVDSDLPVFVLGFRLQGRLTSVSPLGSYKAYVRNVDMAAGLGASPLDLGEIVNAFDKNFMNGGVAAYKYILDFAQDGVINAFDNNFLLAHAFHTCNVGAAPNP